MLPDDKVDLKSLAAYKPPEGLKSMKTTISDDKVNVRPVKPGADKYIKKMQDKLHEAQARVAARKAKEEEEKKKAE